MRKQTPLQANGWRITALLVAVALASSDVTAANSEQFCTHGGQNPVKGDTVACYSDAGCRFAASLGAEPVRDFDPSSAPFALARGNGHCHLVFQLDHPDQKSGAALAADSSRQTYAAQDP
jgi:hypothetical protein